MRVIALWCGLAAVATVVGVVDSLTPGAPHLPQQVLFAAVAGIFVVVGIAAAKLALNRPEVPASTMARHLWRKLPALLRWGALAAIAGGAVVAVLAAPRVPHGVPEVTPHGYLMVTRHGDFLVSTADYLYLRAENERLFAAIALVVNSAAGPTAFALSVWFADPHP
ncbi:hypothetical protein AB0878_25230 [Amycolatopsis sp. NPDC047767]|uniref:hypothetical protein n=1 Tax=Amycolatopsis sp. NPDC047767 TaxID=3156765 RepID=UPI00345624E1